MVVNHSGLDAAAVTSLELQDGQSEPIRPTIIDDEPWPIGAGESVATEVTFDAIPDGAYKIEALVSIVDETGEIHGTLAETYWLVAQGVVSELSFAEWLPFVNVSQAVLDPNDPDPEAGEEEG